MRAASGTGILEGHKYSGNSHQEVLEAEILPPGTSAQKAKLTVLIRALYLGAKKKVTTYTDSRYAFSVVRAHGAR